MFKEITIETEELRLNGHLSFGDQVKAWVIFAHGSGSSRLSSRNNWVARQLNAFGYATLLFDLLTEEEDLLYQNRFNIPLIADRLLAATDWLMRSEYYHGEAIGYFGASTGAAAALTAAAKADLRWPIFTIICRGGRPDLTDSESLRKIFLPVLLLVGQEDREVIALNQLAENELKNVQLSIVPGATHLFEEPGTLEDVTERSLAWLNEHLPLDKERQLST